MDISAFNTRAAAEAGAEMILRHPATGEEMKDENGPAVVIVRGTESASAQNAMKAIRQKRLGEEKDNADDDPAALEALQASLVEVARPLILGFKNVALGGRQLTAADAEEFFGLNMISVGEDEKGLSFVEQVISFAGRRANFLPKPVKGRRSTSGSSAGSTLNAKA